MNGPRAWFSTLVSCGVGAGLSLMAAPVFAQRPPPVRSTAETAPPEPVEGDRGLVEAGFLLTVERITGVVGYTTKTSTDNDFGNFERRRSGIQFHLFAASGSVNDGHDGVNVSTVPRLAVDVPIGPGITVGGGAGLMVTTGSEEFDRDGEEQPEDFFPDTTVYIVHPRLGFLLPVSRTVTLWPRVGVVLSGASARDSSGRRNEFRSTQLSIEPVLVLSPVEHVNLMFFPLIDVGLGGRNEAAFSVSGLPMQSSVTSYRTSSYGVSFSLGVAF